MYLPTVFIDDESLSKLLSGSISLQTGQWIQLGWLETRSRWVGVSAGGIAHIQHYKRGYSASTFSEMAARIRR